MITRFIVFGLAGCTAALAAPDPARLRFKPETIGVPPLSLAQVIGNATTAPKPEPFEYVAPVPTRPAPRRPAAVLPLVEPDSSVDYKVRVVPPDSTIDFKLTVIPPGDKSRPQN